MPIIKLPVCSRLQGDKQQKHGMMRAIDSLFVNRIAMPNALTQFPLSQYRGRFAPSPTGPLHLGSLFTAIASWLDAKANHGSWLIRIEDIDPPREMPSAKADILAALDAHHLVSDEPIVYQSQRSELYQAALQQLQRQQQLFYCDCSRKQLIGLVSYPGTCYEHLSPRQQACAVKLRADRLPKMAYFDLIQGEQAPVAIDDFVLQRKDQLWAYQLAVVVDDAQQAITHVIRGIDLIDSTVRHLTFQQLLGYAPIQYGHLPVIVASDGQKLSKQNFATPLDLSDPLANIAKVLQWLNINEFDDSSIDAALTSAIQQWHGHLVSGMQSINN